MDYINLVISFYLRPYIQEPFAKITEIKKVGCNIKFAYNYYCFYNFILKRESYFMFST